MAFFAYFYYMQKDYYNDVIEILKKNFGWKWTFYKNDNIGSNLVKDTIKVFDEINPKNCDEVFAVLNKNGWNYQDTLTDRGKKLVKNTFEVYTSLKRKSPPNLFWRLINQFAVKNKGGGHLWPFG